MARRPSATLRTNRAAWDRTVRRHAQYRGDEAERLRRGEDPLDLTALDGEARRLLGDLAGKDVLHALCNHGAVTIALSRRCRSILGVDLSPAAVREATALAKQTGSDARFQPSEIVAFFASTRRRFDVVVALWGVTCWLADLDAFARGVRRVLRPGGRFVLLDGHPILNGAVGAGGPGARYFPGPGHPPTLERWTLDYVGTGHGVEVDIAWWRWTLGDIVSAFARAGLAVEELREHEGSHPEYWGSQVPVERDGTSSALAGQRGIVPQAYSLTCRRP